MNASTVDFTLIRLTRFPCSCRFRLFGNNGSDEVASNEEVTTSNTNGQETQTQMTLAQQLYAFVAYDKNEEE